MRTTTSVSYKFYNVIVHAPQSTHEAGYCISLRIKWVGNVGGKVNVDILHSQALINNTPMYTSTLLEDLNLISALSIKLTFQPTPKMSWNTFLHVISYCQLEIAMLWWLSQTQQPSSSQCLSCDWLPHFEANQLSPSAVWLKQGVVLLLDVVGCYLSCKYRAGIGDYQYHITSLFTVFPNDLAYFLSSFHLKKTCKPIFPFCVNISFSSAPAGRG